MGPGQLGVLHDHLLALPESMPVPRRTVTLAQLLPAIRRLGCYGVVHYSLSDQRLHRVLSTELVSLKVFDGLCWTSSVLCHVLRASLVGLEG